MISSTWQPFAINFSLTPASSTVSVSAAVSGDGQSLVLRYVNNGGPDTVTLRIIGMRVDPIVKFWQLQSDNIRAENTAAFPTNIAPQQGTLTLGAAPLQLPAQSFTVLLFAVAL
jgi:alpha-L-arabinofuranosidase